MKRLGIIVFVIGVLVACQTAPPEIPDDLSQAELIQLAQDASDQEHYDVALAYYQAIVERYPQDRSALASARYEIAFIEFKRGELVTAKADFEELLGMYDFEANSLPAWPQVLAQRILEEIDATLPAKES